MTASKRKIRIDSLIFSYVKPDFKPSLILLTHVILAVKVLYEPTPNAAL